MTRRKKSGALDPSDNAPAGVPPDPARFWRAAVDLTTLHPPDQVDRTPTLKRLGPLPFAGSGFPLMGFLATLYEHVANFARDGLNSDGDSSPGGSP